MKFKSKKNVEKLVAEQNGGRHFWLGLFISVLIGFIIRAYISPQNIHRYLVKATASVGSDVQISWSNASLNLRKGLFLPSFALEIENFQLVSVDSCAGEPILFSKKVEIPVHFFDWISLGKPLQSLFLTDSFLEFRTKIECRQKVVKSSNTEVNPVQKAVRMKAKDEIQSRPPLVLKGFYFEKIKIRHPQFSHDLMVDQFEIQVIENQPWYVTLKAQFPIPETESVDSLVQIQLSYKEFPSPRVDLNIKGHWREGNFEAKGDWNLNQQIWKIQSQFNHFPLQFLKMISQKAKTPWNWPDHPMWFSFNLQAEDKVQDISNLNFLLRGVHIEGDLGELKVPDLRIVNLKPLKVEPFVFQADQINLDQVLAKQFKLGSPLESLGVMSGQGQWIAQNEFRFSGEFDKIKIHAPTWVSNHLVWKLKANLLTAHLKKGKWEFSSKDLALDGSPIEGQLHVTGDQDLKVGKLKTQLKLKKLPHKVLPALNSVDVNNLSIGIMADWNSKSGSQWSLDYAADNFENDAVKLNDIKGNIKSKNLGWDLKTTISGSEILSPLNSIQKWPLAEGTWPLKLGSTQLLVNSKDKVLNWKWTGSKLNFEGILDSENKVQGSLKINNQLYRISKDKTEESINLVPN